MTPLAGRRGSYHDTLSGDDVDALFAGNYDQVAIAKCDSCALPIRDNDALTFGDPGAIIHSAREEEVDGEKVLYEFDWTFEYPLESGGPLEAELRSLRQRHHRELITLCYPCVDVLQEPPFGWRKPHGNVVLRATTPLPDEMPRLFAVE